MIKSSGFTLAEILITLGIISVVAAITIPALIEKYTEIRTINQLKADQSIISQAIRMSEEENGEVEGWEISNDHSQNPTPEAANIIANYIKPFLKIAVDCGVNDPNGNCVPANNYKRLNGANHGKYNTRTDCYKIVLMNGSALWWRGAGYSDGQTRHITFWVDINGKYPPNVYGKDLFVFVYQNGSIQPLGAPDGDSVYTKSCIKSGDGFGCAYYVLTYKNMNYLR